MEGRVFTVAILGAGARGGNVYGGEIMRRPDKFRISAICDKRADRLEIYGGLFGVAEDNRFLSEDEFLSKRRADALIISTYDKDHARQAIKAMELGYTVLLEKPVATSAEELSALMAAERRYGGRVIVCHVLRYSPIFEKLIELAKGGEIGRLITVAAEEPVNYWHQAHSFVRGNARGGEASASMLLAKCCHDLDLICALAGGAPLAVSSIGGLDHFKAENAPSGSAERCTECDLSESCPYSAKRIYIDGWHKAGKPENSWPTSALAPAPITEEKLWDAILGGIFGRCVYRCDNDAVDNQFLQASFDNGVRATLSMTAFNEGAERRYILGGSLGSITLDSKAITMRIFGGEAKVFELSKLSRPNMAHGGGDSALIDSLYSALCGESSPTMLEYSEDGYKLGMAAERSRELGGELVRID